MTQDETQSLGTIPGLGRARVAALQAAGVMSLADLIAMQADQIAAIKGIGQWQARKILEFLRHQGLLVAQVAPESGEVQVRLREPTTVREAELVETASTLLRTQAGVEEALEAGLTGLRSAAASAEAAHLDQLADEESSLAPEEPVTPRRKRTKQNLATTLADSTEPSPTLTQTEAPRAEADQAPQTDPTCELRAALPEHALGLLEAIRAAAVLDSLPRELTRFSIVVDEAREGLRALNEEEQLLVHDALQDVSRSLRRAAKKRLFGVKEQKALAAHVRSLRKALESMLDLGHE